jgi:hypothetical protein
MKAPQGSGYRPVNTPGVNNFTAMAKRREKGDVERCS